MIARMLSQPYILTQCAKVSPLSARFCAFHFTCNPEIASRTKKVWNIINTGAMKEGEDVLG